MKILKYNKKEFKNLLKQIKKAYPGVAEYLEKNIQNDPINKNIIYTGNEKVLRDLMKIITLKE